MKTEDEKQKLIEAINCKFPQNNIMELYYNIGRVLPFTAQRFETNNNLSNLCLRLKDFLTAESLIGTEINMYKL